MNKTTLGLLGAVSALAAFSAVNAAPVSPANSFAELLDPIPNAVARLKADDAVRKAEPAAPAAEEDDSDCRPMSRAGCFRPRKPPPVAQPSPGPTHTDPKPEPATPAPAGG